MPLRPLAALVRTHPKLIDAHFKLLASHLDTRTEAPVPLLAAQALSEANLTARQMLLLARDYASEADPLTWPNLVRIFKQASSPDVEATATQFLSRFKEDTRERLGKLHELERRLPSGEVGRGRKILYNDVLSGLNALKLAAGENRLGRSTVPSASAQTGSMSLSFAARACLQVERTGEAFLSCPARRSIIAVPSSYAS